MRVCAVLLTAAALSACGTVPIPPPSEEAPLFQRIDARIGTNYTAAARLAYVSNPVMRVDVGQASVTRFESAFGAMFTEMVELPDWPPWRHAAPAVDAVIELERVDAELRLADGRDKADSVSITYRVCLYEPNGEEIQCWTPSAQNSHQRSASECVDLRKCIAPQVEIAMRDAVALFLVTAERDPAIRAWAAQLREQRAKP